MTEVFPTIKCLHDSSIELEFSSTMKLTTNTVLLAGVEARKPVENVYAYKSV